MFRQQKLSILDDYFKELSVRTTREEVYFYRISGYTPQVAAFIRKYYEEARLRGVVIEGRIPNPAGQNLSYYDGHGFSDGSWFYRKSFTEMASADESVPAEKYGDVHV